MDKIENKERVLMPVLFLGHGSPVNAIEDNEFSRGWKKIAAEIPRPKQILCISAHWETWGTCVTSGEKPRTIHDFGGFQSELYDVSYPAKGDPKFARLVKDIIKSTDVQLEGHRGLDHGCWSVLRRMYPEADIPVVQMSLDDSKPPEYHYELAKELLPLRERGTLIIGSGNMVHNLYMVQLKNENFNEPYGFDWAIRANDMLKKMIRNREHKQLADYKSLGKDAELAIPTPEHYLPMLYVLALQGGDEDARFFNDKPLAGSLTMTSFIIK